MSSKAAEEDDADTNPSMMVMDMLRILTRRTKSSVWLVGGTTEQRRWLAQQVHEWMQRRHAAGLAGQSGVSPGMETHATDEAASILACCVKAGASGIIPFLELENPAAGVDAEEVALWAATQLIVGSTVAAWNVVQSRAASSGFQAVYLLTAAVPSTTPPLEVARSWLCSRVLGQEDAIHSVIGCLTRSSAGLAPSKPSMLFSGPPGVGKCTLARALAELLSLHWVVLECSTLTTADIIRTRVSVATASERPVMLLFRHVHQVTSSHLITLMCDVSAANPLVRLTIFTGIISAPFADTASAPCMTATEASKRTKLVSPASDCVVSPDYSQKALLLVIEHVSELVSFCFPSKRAQVAICDKLLSHRLASLADAGIDVCYEDEVVDVLVDRASSIGSDGMRAFQAAIEQHVLEPITALASSHGHRGMVDVSVQTRELQFDFVPVPATGSAAQQTSPA